MLPRIPLLVVCILLVPTALAAWTTEGGDVGRSYGTTAPLPTKDVVQVWNASGQYTGIVIAPDGSIVATGDPVAVFEPDGTPRWSNRTLSDGKVFRARGAPGLLSDGTIVVGGHIALGRASVIAFNPANGSQPWALREFGHTCDSIEETSVAVGPDDSIYIGHCGDGPGIIALKKDGTVKWKHTGEADRVALGGTNVYAEVEDYRLANGTVYEEAIVAFAQADGSLVWAAKLGDGGTDPLVAKDGTIVTIDEGYVTALAPADGSVKWKTIVPRPFALAIGPNGTIAAASSSIMSWIDLDDGKLLGQSPTKDGRKLVVGNGVHLRSIGAALTGIDPSGKVLWEVTGTSREFQSNIAVGDDGAIYVAEDGQLRAYKGAGGTTSATPTSTSPATSTPSDPTNGNDAAAEGEKGSPGPALALVVVAVAALALVTRRRR